MRSSSIRILFVFFLPILLLTGCGGETVTVGGSEGIDFSIIPIPFTGESKMGAIEGEPYRYFRYENTQDALRDQAKVSKDGKKIGSMRYDWGKPIHFYHFKERIVIYPGDNPSAMEAIEAIFGKQFAGS